jgi:hypothetical protein
MGRQDPEISLYIMIFGFRILAHRPKVRAVKCNDPIGIVSLHKIQFSFTNFNMKQFRLRVDRAGYFI